MVQPAVLPLTKSFSCLWKVLIKVGQMHDLPDEADVFTCCNVVKTYWLCSLTGKKQADIVEGCHQAYGFADGRILLYVLVLLFIIDIVMLIKLTST